MKDQAQDRVDADSDAASGGVKVLYVGGSNRSGSTLLDRILDQIEGMFSTGELMNIWARFLSGERLCGCGRPMAACEFWHRVGEVAFGGWDELDVDALRTLAKRAARIRLFVLILLPGIWPPHRRRMVEYGAILRRLYAAIAQVSGAGFVVDSSKSPAYALFLHRVGIDIRVFHLVRDSRGVAYSLVRPRRRGDVPDELAEMPTKPPASTAITWLLANWLTEALRLVGVPVCRIRYEHLAADPVAVLEPALAELTGSNSHDLHFIEPGVVRLGTGHTVDGNPMRLEVGTIRLAPNESWITGLSVMDRLMVTTLTWPLLLRYGYLGDRHRAR